MLLQENKSVFFTTHWSIWSDLQRSLKIIGNIILH